MVRPEWWYDGSGNYLNAINYAWESLSGVGGTLLIGSNTYAIDLSGGYLIPRSNTTLTGIDKASSVLSFTFAGSPDRETTNGIVFTNQTNVAIRNLSLVGDSDITQPYSSANGTMSGIWFQPSSNDAVADIEIEDCYFSTWYLAGILSYGTSGEDYPHYTTTRVRVNKCTFENIGGHGVGMNELTDSSVTNCHMINIGQIPIVNSNGSGLGVDVSGGCRDIVVCNNVVDGAGGGFKSETHNVNPSLQKTVDNGVSYTNYTTEINGAGVADISSFDTAANGDWIVVGGDAPFRAVHFVMTTVNANASVATIEYWNGAWESMPKAHDNTSLSGATLGQTGAMYWDDAPDDWVASTINSIEKYWVRISVSATLDAAVTIDTVYALIPSQNVKFVGNTVKNLYTSIVYFGIKSSGWDNVIDNNTIESYYHGISVNTPYGTPKNNSIINNTILSTVHSGSIGIYVNKPVIGVTHIENNKVYRSGSHGIYTTANDIEIISNTIADCVVSGIYVNGADRISVVNNKVYNNNTGGSGYGIFFLNTCSNIQILNNKVYDTRTGDNRTQLYGLYCPADTVTGIIKGNWFYNNKTAAIYPLATAYTGIVGELETVKIADLAAGTSDEVPILVASGNGIYVMNVYLVPAASITQNDTDYISFNVLNKGADGTGTSALCSASKTTKVTGGTAFNAFVPTSLGVNANRELAPGHVLSLLKSDSGGGQELDEAIVVIDYISF